MIAASPWMPAAWWRLIEAVYRATRVFRLPIGYRIEATHPQWGAITFFHDHPVSADDCRVAVDESRVVRFG